MQKSNGATHENDTSKRRGSTASEQDPATQATRKLMTLKIASEDGAEFAAESDGLQIRARRSLIGVATEQKNAA
jgi:hypothetical protein